MENDISRNNINQVELDTTNINLGINNVNINDEKTNSKKHKKKKNKIFTKNVDIIKLHMHNLSNFNQDNSYYKFVGKSIFLFFNKDDEPLLIFIIKQFKFIFLNKYINNWSRLAIRCISFFFV